MLVLNFLNDFKDLNILCNLLDSKYTKYILYLITVVQILLTKHLIKSHNDP